MRFVWAVAAFVLAAVMIGAGIAQRTVFQGPTRQVERISIADEAPYVLVDGAVLGARSGSQTVRAQGEGTVFAAYGRTSDMTAWLAASDYVHLTLGRDGTIDEELVEPAAVDPATIPAEGEAAPETPDAAAVNPVGSDLWLDEFQQEGTLVATVQLPEDMSILLATDGTQPAPSRLSISWPLVTETPWAGPLIVGGSIVLLVGAVLYVLGIRHARRSRGPRRKGLPMPVTEPIDLSAEQSGKGMISAGSIRRALARRRRAFVVVPLTAAALLVSGCTSDAWPQFGSAPTPTPTETVIVPEGQQQPAVTETQAGRILQRISEQVAAADEALDPTAAGARLTGPALAERLTNYTLRAAIADQPSLPAIPAEPVSLLLPQAQDAWPRTFMAVVEDEADKTATVMLATQEDPWSDYKLAYSGSLKASTELPAVAPAYVGASLVAPDSPFLVMAPEDLATAYADVLNKGNTSEHAALFDEAGDPFRAQVAEDHAKRLESFNQTGAQTGVLEFSSSAGSQAPIALATLESGAIVAVNVNETETVKPTSGDAVIKLPDNPIVATLSGTTQSATGFTTTFSDQIFFFVPAQGSSERIQLLGWSSAVLDAKVIP